MKIDENRRKSTSCTGAADPFSGAFSIFHTLMLENYPRDRPQTAGRVSPGTLVCAKKFWAIGIASFGFKLGENQNNR